MKNLWFDDEGLGSRDTAGRLRRVAAWLCRGAVLSAMAMEGQGWWEFETGGPLELARREVVSPTVRCDRDVPSRFGLSRKVAELLKGLGSGPGQVAATLATTGVRGQRGKPGLGPLGLFLSAVVGADPAIRAVQIRPDAVTVVRCARWHANVTVPFTPAISTFIKAFDAGCYPELSVPPSHPRGKG